MKLNKLFLIGAVALGVGLTACNNDNEPTPNPSEEGTTFAGLQVAVAKSQFRATPTQGDEAGRLAESEVAQIELLSDRDGKTWSNLHTGVLPSEYAAGTMQFFNVSTGIYTVSPWKTSAGPQNLALVLNGAQLSNKGDIAGAADYKVALSDNPIADFSTDGKFVMTSKKFAVSVKPNITKATIQSTSNSENVFATDVERVVCQGIVVNRVSTSAPTTANTTDGKGALSGLKYGGAMGASITYLYANHAGSRTMDATSPFAYAEYKSAIDGVTVNNVYPTDFTSDPGDKFAKAEITSLALISDYDASSAAAGFYFLENSMPMPADNTAWKFTRNAYAKVYGVYTPKTVYERETGDKLIFVEKAGTGLWFDTSNLDTAPITSNSGSLKEGYVKSDKLLKENTSFTTGADLFKGEQDGFFYSTPEAASSSVSAPGQKSYKYKEGKCVYRSLWNRANDGSDPIKTKNGNTRRNNLYLLKVTAFAKVGMNYDPNDPTDPNIPKPDDNPYEPATPQDGGDPTVDDQDTYMRVTATILPWNKVSRAVTLK